MTIGEDNRVRYKNATDAIIKLIDLRFAPCVYALQKTVRSKTIMAMKYYINRLNRWLAEWTAEEKIGYSITQPFIITFTLK